MYYDKEITIEFDRKKIFASGILILLLAIITFSYFTALLAFIAPSRDYPLKVDNVNTRDTSNNTKTTFVEGETIRINSTIIMALEYVNYPWSYSYFNFTNNVSFRLIVTIMDPNKIPVFFSYKDYVVSAGTSLIDLTDFDIPSGATPSTYSVSVMVWSDWLPNGDPLSFIVGERTFDVTA